MKKFLLVFVLFFTVGLSGAYAQTRTLTGKVVNAGDKTPVIGATVIIEGTSSGAITDNDGMFMIANVHGEVKLNVSYVGFEEKTVTVPATQTNVLIELTSSSIAMGDVVVTGYGNYSKKAFTGAAQNVDMSEVSDVPALSVANLLSGNVSGVTVNMNQGGPGSTESVRIRGRGSINAGNDPLYVIDGVPMTTSSSKALDFGGGGHSTLASVNPNDIASMTVIKDAAAASLYGSRAANGVIVITTKQGQAGKTRINVKGNWGFSDMAINWRPQLDGPARRELLYQGLVNEQLYKKNPATPEEAEAYADKEIKKYAEEPWSGWTNWRPLLFRKGFYQNYEASISGGNENTKFYSSVSYTDQQGIAIGQDYDRITGRLNLTSKAGRFTFNANTMFSFSEQESVASYTSTFSYGAPFTCYAWFCSPSQYPYLKEPDADGNRFSRDFPAGGNLNPLEQRQYSTNPSKNYRTMVSGSAAYNILDGFDIKETFAYDIINERTETWYDPRGDAGKATNGWMRRYTTQFSRMTSQTHLTYRNTFADKHYIDVLAGYEIEEQPYYWMFAQGKDFSSPYLSEIKNAADRDGGDSGFTNTRLVSYVAKADYNYDGRYYIAGSYRMDGSSRLSPKTRWGSFWSVSGSWVISNESFVEPISDILSLAKIRASYGVNGTLPKGYYEYMGLYTFGNDYNYADQGGMDLTQVENDALTWEKNYAFDIGFDLSLWNRLNVSFDWYNRDTKGLLISKDVSRTSGFTSLYQNLGEMNNEGIEFSIDGDIFANRELNWNLGLNLAHNKNTLMRLDGAQNSMIWYYNINQVGQPYISFYMKEFAEVNSETGEAMYYLNDPIYDTEGNQVGYDKTLVTYGDAKQKIVTDKRADPIISGGLNSTLTWKGIDFSFLLTFQLGAHVYDGIIYQFSTQNDLYGGAVPVYYDITKMWKESGQKDAELPMFKRGRPTDEYSDKHLMSTDHLRLKNITLGYTFPSRWMNKIGIDRMRVYASATNLLTWKNKDCVVDPEAYNYISFESPNLKTVTFGIDITF